ncbi:hypothetical protein K491DRAFT_778387 [Lophiostoma macrostomum CBS 122681]|uniref:Transcription factor domain-containing protein n=1 Tax=Lophiostoma macrostomum CBS 122681 TaxID=1314788 RepID=A0A6A6T964_9PLEO|nr:hypothetical protein K491DRAFT_778387 [Lophiostoma macrostomum CBS 122681]
MNSIHNMDGLDQVGHVYMVQAVKMAHNLDLFALSEGNERTEMDRARQYTAWCLFSWQAMVLFHYRRPTLFKQPPRTRLPDPHKDPSFYGEIYVKYPQSSSLHPVHHPSAFFQTAKLHIVLNNLANGIFGGSRNEFPIDKAVSYQQVLLRWFQDLPPCLTPSNIAFPHQLQMHLHYQHVMMLLFEPFLASKMNTVPLATLTGSKTTVKDIIKETQTRFETIIRLYYLRHSFTTYAPVMLQFLSVLGFANVRDARTPSDRLEDQISSLLLAIHGLHHQGSAAHLSNTVFRLLYKESPIDAVNIANRYLGFEEPDMDSDLMTRYTKAAFPVNVVGIDADVEDQRLNKLLRKWTQRQSD